MQHQGSGVICIADDILTYGRSEIEHKSRLITMLAAAQINNLSLIYNKMQFKSQDCKFFGHSLTPQGLKVDPDKVKAITLMKLPESTEVLTSCLGMVNYLSHFSTILAELSEPLHRLCKWDVMWT